MRSPGWRLTRRVFAAGLGVVAVLACASWWTQVHGLVGEQGLVPVVSWMAAHLEQGSADVAAAPSLLWLWPGDTGLTLLCAAGVLLGALLTCDRAPGACCAGLWAVYLSLVHGGGPFLQFQWDTLLVESLAVGALALPWRWRPGPSGEALPLVGRLLLGWLLFRLMFESGVVKLTSGDAAWPDLTALAYHHETQPLPHVFSWWLHQLPGWAHRALTASTLVVELGAPWLLLGGRRLRHLGALVMAALMLGVGASGNYGIFNLLTIVLCLALLDDRCLSRLVSWPRRPRLARATDGPAPAGDAMTSAAPGAPATEPLPAGLARRDAPAGPPDESPAASPAASPVASRLLRLRTLCARGRLGLAWTWLGLVALVGALQVEGAFAAGAAPRPRQREAGVLETLASEGPLAAGAALGDALGPWLSVNSYGLFRVMTRTRPEILLEASLDGATWEPYILPFKPGDPALRPGWAQPHMPRLDWQLWFEALRWEAWWQGLRRAGSYPPSLWFGELLAALGEQRPGVLALCAAQPLGGRPPRFVRARLARYRFATAAERGDDGRWWRVTALDERGLVWRADG